MTIQWYPGHMAKAKREVQEKLKLVDIVIELVDARAPYSTQNPMLQELIDEKKKVIVLMKDDLADPQQTKKWIDRFKAEGNHALSMDVNQGKHIKALVEEVKTIGQNINKRREEKGINPRAIRAMVIGIPNVGKSTLINRLANKKTLETGDKPGVTKKQKWIKVHGQLELLDTPGILWPKFEDQDVGYKVAAIGSIKDQLVHLDDLSIFVLKYFKEKYPNQLKERFPIDWDSEVVEWFDQIGKQRGCLMGGGMVDYEKTAEIIIQDLRSGKLGPFTLDHPIEIN
ncbi:ribosome biogenesis GTPase YlqF [Halalkalibacillus sediminis]|uniref:Ribosome biogenesis GTPase A n=1 Tax=Halalkalibacillus sediminis TaxID=2018042 RepID=A0A2I0QW88_9BACI|nr:ribosome biogenesis GTPase YlqF [Halalkalibacillus sediminis]PKR78603.1 ribosome biogenesis GTPase YlqF [Halalkalibacillus sediminis]